MRTIVQAGARLHCGFLDLNGACGRRYGSIGVTLERPRCTVEASPVPPGAPPGAARVRAILERLGPDLGGAGVAVRVVEEIPAHAGFGAGTQLGLAVALAASRARGRAVPVPELARRLGRGRRSGAGLAAFERGGLVIDAGRRTDADGAAAGPGGERDQLPPVVFHHPLPEDWCFVLATPRAAPGLSGASEREAFERLPPMDAERVGRICRLTLMQVAPAALTGDIRTFGAAITEIQEVVGDYFAPCQGGRFASPTGGEVAGFVRARGALGSGQSSWGPTVFALVAGEGRARTLADALRGEFGDRLERVGWSGPRNRGASCETVP